MPSLHQQESLQALFGLFLAPVGSPLPQHCQLKSAGALSRFLNHYGWPTRQVIRRVRSWVLEQSLAWTLWSDPTQAVYEQMSRLTIPNVATKG